MIKKVLLGTVAAIALLSTTVSAQEFIAKQGTFSYKKMAYIYLENGDSIIGDLEKVGYKKSLIDELNVKKEGEKKGEEIDINTIKRVYLPVSNVAIGFSKANQPFDAGNWSKSGLNQLLLNEGYVLYEKSVTVLKGKEEVLLMQLVNPGFNDKIRVYADPRAGESQSFGVGPVKLAGGDDKSYYVKVGDKPAIKVKSKDFDENISTIFAGCPTLEAKLKEKADWGDFAKYVYEHSQCAQ